MSHRRFTRAAEISFANVLVSNARSTIVGVADLPRSLSTEFFCPLVANEFEWCLGGEDRD